MEKYWEICVFIYLSVTKELNRNLYCISHIEISKQNQQMFRDYPQNLSVDSPQGRVSKCVR